MVQWLLNLCLEAEEDGPLIFPWARGYLPVRTCQGLPGGFVEVSGGNPVRMFHDILL